MIKLRAFLLLFFPLWATGTWAQTYVGAGGNIPDNNTTATFTINVPPLNPNTVNTIFGLEQICININHPYVSDLEVSLRAPDNTTVVLFSGVGGSGDNFSSTCIRQDASSSIITGSAPFTGTFKPQNNMGALNNGQNANGQWRLRIRDMYAQDAGSLISWSITFGSQPAQPFSFTSSDLPILVINTNGGATIPDDPKIPGNLKIIYNGPGVRNYLTDTVYDYNGLIGIERRGSSSNSMPKKSYGFETWNPMQQDSAFSLLGMPSESDWILSANYSDKTQFRNALAYNLANKTGQYAPRTRFCEVVLNGQYIGVYNLAEKIKRDNGRVNIAKLNPYDTAGVELTGGYILKIDKLTGSGGDGWTSAFAPPSASGNQSIYVQYVYPKPANIHPKQELYIKNYVDSFETSLASAGFQDPNTGWRRYMDENSVIDYMLINEMSRNVDGYRISTFFHKQKSNQGSKLKLGPVWDYDIAWLNADYCSGNSTTGWAYNFNNVCGNDGMLVPFWWQRFRQDTLFNKRLYCRYTELRNSFFSTPALHALADSMAAVLDESQTRNFEKWPILGVYVWPNPSPIPNSYAGEVAKLKQWFSDRLAWMDSQINIYASPAPQVNLGADTSICFGQLLELEVSSNLNANWSTGQIGSNILIADSGSYSVQVENIYGCHAYDTLNLSVRPLPNADFAVNALTNFEFQFTPQEANAENYLWNFGNGNTSQSSAPVYTYPAAGAYTTSLVITDSTGCTNTSSQNIQTLTVGIEDLENGNFKVFPNPFVETFFIENLSSNLNITFTIFSATGKMIVNQNTSEILTKFSMGNLSVGLYYLKIVDSGGKEYYLKLVKQ